MHQAPLVLPMPDEHRGLRIVSVLCVSPVSVYRGMPGVVPLDRAADARSYGGGHPIVAHPPCRSWSAFCAHQAKPEPRERELAIWCVEQLRRFGGVLEQPAFSRLWAAAGIPAPGEPARDGVWSIEVFQSAWGHAVDKRTWIAIAHIDPGDLPPIPPMSRAAAGCAARWSAMSKHQRSATPRAFAQWLIDAARAVRLPHD